MKLTFLGAAHEVTGSCFLLETAGHRLLIDCGMEQGPDLYENQPLDLPPGQMDGLLLTHAHIDHSGRIPLLYKQGFSAPVWCTEATADLCAIMLQDSGHIQESEAEWRNRKAARSGGELYQPLYTVADAQAVMKQFVPVPYGEKREILPGIRVRFTDVGHLLGSACIEIWAAENGSEEKIVFSGDVGNTGQPILRDPQCPPGADILVMESTYGDRNHNRSRPDYVRELAALVEDTFARGGNLVIPCFAVGRTQEMLYFFRQIKEQNLAPHFPDFEVYLDSPLAVEATHVFRENLWDCVDDEARALLEKGINPLQFEGLHLSVKKEESQAINLLQGSHVILSASGMCEAGRIRHHLKHNLWRPECTVLFVGYQAVGTLGRALVEGAQQVKLFGEPVQVRAKIQVLAGVSGHADQSGLLRWAKGIQPPPRQVFVVHGDDAVCDEFAGLLSRELGLRAEAPYNGAEYDLLTGRCLDAGNSTRIKKPAATRKVSPVFQRLLNAGQRLLAVIGRNESGANKDLARFADQIDALCDKWDR